MRSEFSPEDIVNQRFLTTIGGYDKEEVRKFLRAIAKELQDKNELIEDYRRRAEMHVASPDADALHEALRATRALAAELGSKLDAATHLVGELEGLTVPDVPAPDTPAPDLPAPDVPVMDVPVMDVGAEDPPSPATIEVIPPQNGPVPVQDAVVAPPEEVEPVSDEQSTEIELPSEEWEELFEDPIEAKRGTPRP